MCFFNTCKPVFFPIFKNTLKKAFHKILGFAVFCFVVFPITAQVQRENGKWGYKSGDGFLIQPIYDTIFGFDSTGRVCLACSKLKSSNTNKFIKVLVTKFNCHYYNTKGEKLMIRNQLNDTFTVFSYSKNALKQYNNSSWFFTVTAKGRKYLMTKDFRQQTFNEYAEIRTSSEKEFYITQIQNEFEVLVTGLVNTSEQVIVPYQYSDIHINPTDSLIIACAAGLRANAEDDVYDFKGKKVQSSRKHLEMATKHFLIEKVYEPKETYLIFNIETQKEIPLQADELTYYQKDEVLIRLKGDWYIYDLQTNQKRKKEKS